MPRPKNILDVQKNPYYLLHVGKYCLAIRLELVGTLVDILLACLFPVYHHAIIGTDPTFAGLAGYAFHTPYLLRKLPIGLSEWQAT